MKDPLPADLPRQLRRSAAFPWRPASVEVIETHISWVFMADEFVVKVKRPVKFDFVDYSTLELRRQACDDEVRLNRRLTGGVYLDAVPITSGPGGPEIDGRGAPLDWATLMRRLPAGRMLDKLIERGSTPPDLAERLAARLIPFHRNTAEVCGGSKNGNIDDLTGTVTDNLTELQPFARIVLPSEQLNLVDLAMRRFINENKQLFIDRLNGNFVRDGHGDLRCEHVCLEDDAIQIFDCVEFSASIRCADIASDLAFLLMDLERLGRRDVARALEQAYRERGVDLPPRLVNFYRAHRALVRAKVDCLTRKPGQQAQLDFLADDARRYLDLATRSATSTAPALIAMTGVSGTGKSTLSAEIAGMLGAPVHVTDVIRKELTAGSESISGEWQRGIYSPDWTKRTYERLFSLAAADLRAGRPTILDGAFLSSEQRSGAASIAARFGVPMILVETFCAAEIAEERITNRRAGGSARSDADVETYRHQRAMWNESPPALPTGVVHVRVDTGQPAVEWIVPVLRALLETKTVTPVIRDRE